MSHLTPSTRSPMEEPPSVRPEVQLQLQAVLKAQRAHRAATQFLAGELAAMRRLQLTSTEVEALALALAEWKLDLSASRPT
jgi:hypothetical protein